MEGGGDVPSPAGADPGDRTTMMTAAVEDGEVDVTLHEE